MLFLFLSASVATITTAAIFLTLVVNDADFFGQVSVWDFLFGVTWSPDLPPHSYGSLPLLKGTFLIGLGAVALGFPIALGTAVYLSEFASDRVRRLLKPAIELLAGIPSIVFGVVALFAIAPLMQEWFGAPLFNAANATIVLGVMVVPIITTLIDDAIRSVPRELREGALALGATKWEATRNVIVPAAASGITAATLLGFSRAIGETMAVTLAAGLTPTLALDFLKPTETVTAYIANRAGGDLPTGSLEYVSIFAIGTLLFVITFAINLVAEFTLARQRRRFA